MAVRSGQSVKEQERRFKRASFSKIQGKLVRVIRDTDVAVD